jgi:23S rRNA (uracil1939-C5)-methyltransferase
LIEGHNSSIGAVVKLQKGSTVTLRIASIAVGGEGISKDLGRTVFVAGTAPGELVKAELFDVRKDFARAKLVDILEPSAARVKPPCGLFGICGGCQLMHLSYAEQLKVKQDFVEQTCERIGGISAELVKPTIGCRPDLHYRNKVQFPVRNPQGSNRLLAGYYKLDSHELVNIKHCPVQPEPVDGIMEAAKSICEEHRISAYDEKTGFGLLRHINVRYSFSEESALLVFVINMSKAQYQEEQSATTRTKLQSAADQLLQQHANVKGVSINFNAAAGNKILGNQYTSLSGIEYIEERLCAGSGAPENLQQGIRYRLSAGSFFQINSKQAVTLFETVRAAVDQYSHQGAVDFLVDAYAGVGAMALWLTGSAKNIVAIEEHPAAVQDGKHNAALNNIPNVAFREGTSESVMQEFVQQKLTPDIVLVDPPRKGLSIQVAESLLQLAPRRIVYVSCNPSTLARDIKILCNQPDSSGKASNGPVVGYKTLQIQPIDLFPHTHHIESVTVLERQ